MGAASTVMLDRLLGERIQFPLCHILLDLRIPVLGIEPGKPVAKLRQLIGLKFSDGQFDFVQVAHTSTIPQRENSGQSLPALTKGGVA